MRCAGLSSGLLLSSCSAMGQSSPSPTFRSSEIIFCSSSIGFTSAPLIFPSAPIQAETPTAIEITLPADVLFDFDKAELRLDARHA